MKIVNKKMFWVSLSAYLIPMWCIGLFVSMALEIIICIPLGLWLAATMVNKDWIEI